MERNTTDDKHGYFYVRIWARRKIAERRRSVRHNGIFGNAPVAVFRQRNAGKFSVARQKRTARRENLFSKNNFANGVSDSQCRRFSNLAVPFVPAHGLVQIYPVADDNFTPVIFYPSHDDGLGNRLLVLGFGREIPRLPPFTAVHGSVWSLRVAGRIFKLDSAGTLAIILQLKSNGRSYRRLQVVHLRNADLYAGIYHFADYICRVLLLRSALLQAFRAIIC